MKNTNIYQALTYYMLSVVTLSVFAFRSYLDEYSSVAVLSAIVVPIVIAATARPILDYFIIRQAPELQHARRQLAVDFGLYLFIAVCLFVAEFVLFSQSFMIALKIAVLTLMVGYFASLDSALERERYNFRSTKHDFPELDTPPVSVAQRMNLFFSMTVLVAIFVCGLTAYSYMSLDVQMAEVKEAFIVDMLFIVSLFVSLTIRLVYSYSMNLQILFDTQVKGLHKIQEGDLDEFVPVLSHDEFGVMAEQTNVIIEQLREKRKLQKTLDEIVSPDISQKLMSGDSQALKEGQDVEVAVLFCDLRKFTTYTENTPSEEVIFFLNAYFTKIADIVAENNGIINKFMGDAILAVYGVDGNTSYIEDAMNTAWDILMHSGTVRMRDGTTFDIGIGVHTGKATACTIGSAERYEYTFIGDTVNTASRLDGLSKELGYRLITSEAVYKELDRETRARFTDLGEQSIRGKYSTLHIYGAEEKEIFDDDDDSNTGHGSNVVSLSDKRAS